MRIIVNGKDREGTWKTAYEVPAVSPKGEFIRILNGFQIEKDIPLKEGDILTVIPKGTMPDERELESMMAARHTPHVHERVKKAKVGIAGLGGLGSHIAVMLARTGIGRLVCVDFDEVEPSNLNRQSYFIRDLGRPKAEALAQQIGEINPFITVEPSTARVTAENAADLFAGCDIVCEAFDDPKQKAMLVNTILDQLPGVKVIAASGMAGYDSSNQIQTKKVMQNLYLCGDFTNEARIGNGLMAPRVEICAGHQANMVLRLLMGIADT